MTAPWYTRTATVRLEPSQLAPALSWALRIKGQSVGGYGRIDHLNRHDASARFASREAADRCAAIWIETGITPAFQTAERIDESRRSASVELAA
jgi:hypothetical protein